jgi:hypothetical protein
MQQGECAMNDDDNDPFVFEEIFGETKEKKLQTIWRYLEELREHEKRQAGLRQETIPTDPPNDPKIDEVVALMKEIDDAVLSYESRIRNLVDPRALLVALAGSVVVIIEAAPPDLQKPTIQYTLQWIARRAGYLLSQFELQSMQ